MSFWAQIKPDPTTEDHLPQNPADGDGSVDNGSSSEPAEEAAAATSLESDYLWGEDDSSTHSSNKNDNSEEDSSSVTHDDEKDNDDESDSVTTTSSHHDDVSSHDGEEHPPVPPPKPPVPPTPPKHSSPAPKVAPPPPPLPPPMVPSPAIQNPSPSRPSTAPKQGIIKPRPPPPPPPPKSPISPTAKQPASKDTIPTLPPRSPPVPKEQTSLGSRGETRVSASTPPPPLPTLSPTVKQRTVDIHAHKDTPPTPPRRPPVPPKKTTATSTTNIKKDQDPVPLIPPMFSTPNQPTRSNTKFVFLSDQKHIPTDLKRLQLNTMKRRRHLMARMHDLDCQVAKLTAQYAEEKMDLGLALRDSLGRSVCEPLQEATERLVMERESSSQRGDAVASLEQRLTELEIQMTKHIHVTLHDKIREDLDSLHHELYQDIIPGIQIDDTKSDKIEGGVMRRYDVVAGGIARQFHQEAAARRAALETLQTKVSQAVNIDEKRGDELLKSIQEMRRKVQRERVTRRAADQELQQDIMSTIAFMKRSLLAAVGGMGLYDA
eukprot:Nitzschia sp. Nitz4//scaffold29_size155292//8920//10582//NITZ4_002633-RA/size155292-processed-gene-0.236-mRNA-1//1//CDS//3329546373//6422//frame0